MLKRRGQDIYFYREKRKIAGIAEAMENLNCNRGTIITVNQDELIHHRGKEIKVVPAWRWLLENNQPDMYSS